jgi:DNA-binding NtrC family response regulator
MAQPQVRILVVDDERNIRNNLTAVLQSAGYKVDASGDGEDALDSRVIAEPFNRNADKFPPGFLHFALMQKLGIYGVSLGAD